MDTEKIYEAEVLEEDQQSEDMKMDFYRRLRMKIDGYIDEHPGLGAAKYLAAVPDVFYLLVRLTIDSQVPPSAKAKLAGAVMYYVSPLDLVPDFIPVVGWLDDLIVGVTLLNRALDDIDPAIVDKYWLGDYKIYDFIKETLDKGDKLVGTKIWNKIKKLFAANPAKTESKGSADK